MGAATGKARHAGFEPVGDVSMQDVCRGPRRLEHKNPFVGVSNTVTPNLSSVTINASG